MTKPARTTKNKRGDDALPSPNLARHIPHVEGDRLWPEHLRKIQESALTTEQVQKLGWCSLHNGRLLIPYLKPDGTPEICHDGAPFIRQRLSDKEIRETQQKGEPKPGRYRSPWKQGCRLYHSHLALQAGNYQQRLSDRFTPLRFTEGELKTEAAAAYDPERITIGLGGVSSWQDRYDGGDSSMPLVDFDEIPLDGREVRVCFDSDLSKPQVAAALREFCTFLANKGAKVLVEVLPHGLDGQRLGLDDLIYRHGAEVFHNIAGIAQSPFKERVRRDKQGTGVTLEWKFSPEPTTTHQRNVYLAGLLGREWRFDPSGTDRWQRWTGTHWESVAGNDALLRTIEEFFSIQGWQERELPAIRSLLAAFRRIIEPAAEHDAPGLLPFLNGCLVLATGQRVPHSPAHGNTWILPYEFDSAATCKKTEAFLLDRLEDPASVAIFRAFARGLLLQRPHKAFLEITGARNTGKSVLEAILVALVGQENHASCKLQRLEDPSQRFETLKLKDKRLAVFSEAQSYSGALEMVKALTGRDPIAAEVKGGRHVDFTFHGGVVLVGNTPIRPSDATGAVVTRRRALYVTKVVATKDQRELLEPDGRGGWRGELVPELAGIVNWCLAMTDAEAKAAMASDVPNLHRAESELRVLLETDSLAQWADLYLAWDETATGDAALRVGTSGRSPAEYLYPSYLAFIEEQGKNEKPLGLRTFKAKFVDLVRDTLGLPMPPGAPTTTTSGPYRVRGIGSVIPCLRRRAPESDEPGVIRTAHLRRVGTVTASCGTDRERIGNDESPVGNGWIGKETFQGCPEGDDEEDAGNEGHWANPYSADTASVPSSVPSLPDKVLAVSESSQIRSTNSSAPRQQLLLPGAFDPFLEGEDDPAWGPRPGTPRNSGRWS